MFESSANAYPWLRESRPWSRMLAVLGRRSYRLGVLVSLALLAILISLWHSGWTDSADIAKLKQQLADILPRPGAAKSAQEIAAEAPAVYVPTIDPYAHRLPNAYYFRDHFFNVTYKNPITQGEAKSTCNWPNLDDVNFQFGEGNGLFLDLSWVGKPVEDPAILKGHRDGWHDFLADDLLLYERYVHKFKGRGIVLVGGQGKSLKRTQIIMRQLKRLGCKLPIELHYWGTELMENHGEELLRLWPNLTFNNLASPDNIVQTQHGGAVTYALKTAAILNSRFSDIIMLDTDNIPVQDPDTLFDTATYKEFGTIFWPDIARTRVNNPMWPITNTHCRMDEWEQESGQLVVNKHRFWYHLQLSHWFNAEDEHSQYFRRVMLGDKDTFRFAWHALKTEYGKPGEWLTSVGTLHGDFYCGHTFAQYHPNGKIAFLHGGLLKTMDKKTVSFDVDFNGGVFQAYKRDPRATDPSNLPKVAMIWDGGEYLPDSYKGEGLEFPGWCTDLTDVKARPLEEILPGFEKRYHEIGGYWITDKSVNGSKSDGVLEP